jgi:hypothetical protein
MTSGSLPSNPFVAAGMIKDPKLFVGRKDELRAIASRMSGVQPTSINLVGEKRIGKSSLLYHFFLTWQQRVNDPSRYVVIYLSLQDGKCQTEISFYKAVAEELLKSLSGQKQGLRNSLTGKQLNRQTFSDAIKQWKQQKVLPVLCLDDFESFLKHPNEFDNGFYDNLRSLMDASALMVVISSRKEVSVYGTEHRFVSQFFNVGQTLHLGELTTDEAITLTRLPTRNSTSPALSVEEQNHAQQWGKRRPYLLQLASYWLWEARQNNKSVSWAREQFDKQTGKVSKEKFDFIESSRQMLRWLWDILLHLGRLPTSIGRNLDDVVNRIIGTAVVIMVILVFARVLNWNQVWDFVRDKLGIK